MTSYNSGKASIIVINAEKLLNMIGNNEIGHCLFLIESAIIFYLLIFVSLPSYAATPIHSADFLRAKLEADREVSELGPADMRSTEASVLQLIAAAKGFAGETPSERAKYQAVVKVLYEPGPWNDNRPFVYDLDDPKGQRPNARLLSHYIKTRKGNCVSMPILFLIVADALGMNVSLAEAPLHLFVRYTDPDGRTFNIEPTNGGHFMRTEWLRQNMAITDKAIESGIYLRTLSRAETLATMSEEVVEFDYAAGRYQSAIDVSEKLLNVNPRAVAVILKEGSAYGKLLQQEFPTGVPTPLTQARFEFLARQNTAFFEKAEALGWTP